MVYFLYILKSNNGRHYIGMSSNPKKRLESHNSGRVISTKPYRPWAIVHLEKYENRIEARKREVALKGSFEARNRILEKVK